MTDLKARWLSLIDEYSAETVDTSIAAPVQTFSPEEDSPIISVEEISADDSIDDLPIYEATAKEISYWHASGDNVFLQTLLRDYDLDYSNSAAYNHFKIGLDEKRHVATFAVDNTHYYQIAFDEYNAAPLDRDEARRVLERISAIRYDIRRIENFCGFQIERFD